MGKAFFNKKINNLLFVKYTPDDTQKTLIYKDLNLIRNKILLTQILRLIYVIRLNRKWLIQQQQESTCNEFFAENKREKSWMKNPNRFQFIPIYEFRFLVWEKKYNRPESKKKKNYFILVKLMIVEYEAFFSSALPHWWNFPRKVLVFLLG